MMKNKQTYKNKHLQQLKRVKNFVLAVAFGSVMTGCGQKSSEEEYTVKDMAYYYERGETVYFKDMFGHFVPQKVVEVTVYKNEDMKEERYLQLLWGTPIKDMPDAYQNEKTHAELLYLNDFSEQVWVEVFVNSYGVTVLKDQPCFAADENKKIVYIGDSSTYENNMLAFKMNMEVRKKNQQQKADLENQKYRERQKRWDEEQKRRAHKGLLQKETEEDSVIQNIHSDTLNINHHVSDSIIIAKDSLKRE